MEGAGEAGLRGTGCVRMCEYVWHVTLQRSVRLEGVGVYGSGDWDWEENRPN